MADDADDLFGAPPPLRRAPSKGLAPDDHRHGHRERLRSRFMDALGRGLADYEMLELVLFRAIPRRDVKPIAKRLIARFGDYQSVLSAEPDDLRQVDGVGEAAVIEIKIVERSAHLLARGRVMNRPVMDSWEAVLDHCRASMAHLTVETFRVLFLDAKNNLRADETLQTGTADQVAVFPEEIARRATHLRAKAVILVHNHPSGDPAPSEADKTMTRRIVAALGAVGVTVHDHVVIGAQGEASFRGLKLL